MKETATENDEYIFLHYKRADLISSNPFETLEAYTQSVYLFRADTSTHNLVVVRKQTKQHDALTDTKHTEGIMQQEVPEREETYKQEISGKTNTITVVAGRAGAIEWN